MRRPSSPTIVGLLIGLVCTLGALNGGTRADLLQVPAAVSSSSSAQETRTIYPPLDPQRLMNMQYTLGTDYVRQRLVQAGVPFGITLHDSMYLYGGDPLHPKPYASVKVVPDSVAIADLDGDGSDDAAFALELSGPAGHIIEVELIRNVEGNPVQAGSYPVAITSLNSLSVVGGKALLDMQYVAPGDPDSFVRQSQSTLSLPPQ